MRVMERAMNWGRSHGIRCGRGTSALRGGAILFCLLLVLSACTGTPDTPENPVATSGPSGELVAATRDLGSMEWHPSRAAGANEITTNMVGEALTLVNADTKQMEGMLAESWELSPDSRTWTFKLRPNIPFHDGWGTVTSEDVRATWEAMTGEGSPYGGVADTMARAVDNNMDNFEIVNDLEFRLHTTTPVVQLLMAVCSCVPGMRVHSANYLDEVGFEEANDHPIGTGPWKFVSSTPGDEVVLEAVPDHWRQTPSFQRLILKEIPDGAARLVQVQSGAVDIAQLDAELIEEAEASDDVRISTVPDVANAYVILGGMYYGEPEFDPDAPWIQGDSLERGLAIRQAMSLAIDRQLILDNVLFGQGAIAHAPVAQFPSDPELVDPLWDLPAYDLTLAKQKLMEGGYPDGFPIVVAIFDTGAGTDAVGEAMADMWSELGLQVTLQVTDDAAFTPKEENRDIDGLAWIHPKGFKGEAVLALDTVFSGKSDAKLTHPMIDEYYIRMSEEPDRTERDRLARELFTFMRDQVLGIPLFTLDGPYAVGPKVGDWTPTPGLEHFSSFETATHAAP
jgi:peptide/nickel transport system substrate-binding protein